MSLTTELPSFQRDDDLKREVQTRDFAERPVTRAESLDPAFRQALASTAIGCAALQRRLDLNEAAGYGPQAPTYHRPIPRLDTI